MRPREARPVDPDEFLFDADPETAARRLMSLPPKVRRKLTMAENRCPRGALRLRIFRCPASIRPAPAHGNWLIVPSHRSDVGGMTGPLWLEALDGPVTLRCPCCADETVTRLDALVGT
ncbi:hypothetical protein FEK35_24640 [Nocardia cyriacigeorgica]|uniref:Uncharacterized protein n=1 Tax=Nocardia cyriacigeorgica TaxID=135487 RepID=A0A5R8P7S1_9NOCA|nr:hypothetical protein [Nocardia cyriacigeorgica]TLG00260.1 hypothetical protein FEK35_24640 [Nocardia cyriacigeorgica]